MSSENPQTDEEYRAKLIACFLSSRPPTPFQLGEACRLKVIETDIRVFEFIGPASAEDKAWIEQYRLVGDLFIFSAEELREAASE